MQPDHALTAVWTGTTLSVHGYATVSVVDVGDEVARSETRSVEGWWSAIAHDGGTLEMLCQFREGHCNPYVLQQRDATGALTLEVEVGDSEELAGKLFRTEEGTVALGTFLRLGGVGTTAYEGALLLGGAGEVLEETPFWLRAEDRTANTRGAVSLGHEIWTSVAQRDDRGTLVTEILRLDARGRPLGRVRAPGVDAGSRHWFVQMATTDRGVLFLSSDSPPSELGAVLLGPTAEATSSPRDLGFPGEPASSWSAASSGDRVLVAAGLEHLGILALALLDSSGTLLAQSRIPAEGIVSATAVYAGHSFAVVYTTSDRDVWLQRVCLGRSIR